MKKQGLIEVVDVDESGLFNALTNDLDVGESAAIAFAVRKNADLVLIDEKEGRKAARKQGLEVTGVVGILLKEQNERSIDLEGKLDLLKENGFWISGKLYDRILERADD